MNISIKDRIGISETLIRLYSKVFGKSVGWIQDHEYYGEKGSHYHIDISYSEFGFQSNLFLRYKVLLQENLTHNREITLLKIRLLKTLAQEYQTDILADFPFLQKNDGDIFYYWDYLLCNKEGELFKIDEEPYPYEKIAKKYGYTEDEVSELYVGIIPLYDTATLITEEEMRRQINLYFDTKLNEKNNYQGFWEGIQYADLDEIKKYINKDNINLFDSYNRPPIQLSFETLNPNIVKYFLDLGANPNVSCVFGLTKYTSTIEYMVQQAIDRYYQGDEIDIDIEIINLLYEYGANLNIKNDVNETPLELAMKIPYKKLERFLRSLGAKTSKDLEKEEKNSN